MTNQSFDILSPKERHKTDMAILDLYEDLSTEVEFLSAYQDLMLDRWERAMKAVIAMIIDLSKHGEITKIPRLEHQKEKLQIIVAFDGDEGGRNALDKFVLEQLNAPPKKRIPIQRFQDELDKLRIEFEGLLTNYTNYTLPLLEEIEALRRKKDDKQYNY